MDESLYKLIGGEEKLNSAIGRFYEKVLADETLRRFFDDVDIGQLGYRQKMFVAMLVGGPSSYTGVDLRAAHAGVRSMGLNKTHFNAFLKHFREALEEQDILPQKVDQIIWLLEARRNNVLTSRDFN